MATGREHTSTDLIALSQYSLHGSLVEHNGTECISTDCVPHGDDREAKEEEAYQGNIQVHNGTEWNTDCVPQGDDTEEDNDAW